MRLKQRNLFPHRPGGWSSRSKPGLVVVSPGTLFLDSQTQEESRLRSANGGLFHFSEGCLSHWTRAPSSELMFTLISSYFVLVWGPLLTCLKAQRSFPIELGNKSSDEESLAYKAGAPGSDGKVTYIWSICSNSIFPAHISFLRLCLKISIGKEGNFKV